MTFQQICTFTWSKKGQKIRARVNPPPPLSGNARKLATFFNGCLPLDGICLPSSFAIEGINSWPWYQRWLILYHTNKSAMQGLLENLSPDRQKCDFNGKDFKTRDASRPDLPVWCASRGAGVTPNVKRCTSGRRGGRHICCKMQSLMSKLQLHPPQSSGCGQLNLHVLSSRALHPKCTLWLIVRPQFHFSNNINP